MVGEMKKRLQRKGARRGFTLVELLIVIIIIGILAGAMMMVAGGGRDAAEASKIISDLRSMKSAALMYLTENPAGDTESLWAELDNDPTPLNAFLDRPLIKSYHHYEFANDGKLTYSQVVPDTDPPDYETVTVRNALLLGYKLGDDGAKVNDRVKENLKKQARSAGLYGGKTIDLTQANPANVGYYNGGDEVYVVVQ